MAYTTRFRISRNAIDAPNYQLFAPVLGAMHVHLVEVRINGLVDSEDFWMLHPWLVLDRSELGCELNANSDQISIRVEYFYKAERPGLLAFLTGGDEHAPDKRTSIISKHYIDGHFALDNGLYKEAVLNFGTVVEGILNHDLSNRKLAKMISSERNAAQDAVVKSYLHDLRSLRNRVHPNLLKNVADVSKYEAEQARAKLQEVLLFYKDRQVAY